MRLPTTSSATFQDCASYAQSATAWSVSIYMNAKHVIPITLSTKIMKLENASNANLMNVSTARALQVVSSATRPRITSSTHPPFVKNAQLILVLIARI